MGYIITAEVWPDLEENINGRIEEVEARTLSQEPHKIVFDVRGDFENQQELTMKLCISLIDAGFLSFNVSHSY